MGNRTSFAGESTVTALLTPTAVASPANQTGIDISSYEGMACVTLTSAAGTGTSLTTNGVFTTDASWTKGTGWSIDAADSNVATFAGHTETSDLKQNQACTEGAYYTVVFTISDWTAGTLTAYIGGTAGTARAANGTFTEVILCGDGTDPKLVLTASATFRGSVDAVAVYDMTLDCHLEHSHDNSTYADITGAAFTTVYGIASTQKLYLDTNKLRKWLRIVTTSAGTSESFTCSALFLGVKKDNGATYA